MNPTRRMSIGAVTTAALIGGGQLIAASTLAPTLALALAQDELHNVTYLARVDGVAPGSQATFRLNDNELNTAPLSSLPGQVFEAHTVLLHPDTAGMQVSVPWPYAATVHCEIAVDDNVTTQIDRTVGLTLGANDPNRIVSCGAPLTDTVAGAAASVLRR